MAEGLRVISLQSICGGGRLVIRRQSLYQQYIDYLEYSKPVFSGMLKLLLSHEENLPVLIHCVYGKDRTGVLVALILDCIGVESETIAMDYASSESTCFHIHDGLVSMRNEMYDDLIVHWGMAEHSCRAKADTMLKVLNEIDKRYGSTSQYLKSIGFTLEDQESLKSILLH
uniref:Tyrosine specific protein phosphatases domain-containing protein n=1 Tax=Amphimedon queenslandica TaxID=400682 RepID=A0A1X7UQZ2_AMPQE